MPIALDNSIRVYTLADNHLETPSWAVGGSNRLLVAAVLTSSLYPVQPTACKWGGSGGTSMTLVGGTSFAFATYRVISMYTLTAPTAQTSTGYVSWASTHDEICAFFLNYTGVDQADPLHSIAKVTASGNRWVGSTTNPPQPWALLTVNTATGDKVVALCSLNPGSAGRDNVIAASSGKGTLRLKCDGMELDGWEHCAISDADATGATFQFGWEYTSVVSETYDDGSIGITLKPAAEAGKPYYAYAQQ